jgi:hypothetical protein
MAASSANHDWQQTLLGHLSVHAPVWFLTKVIWLSLVIRFIVFVLREIDLPVKPLPAPFWRPIFKSYCSLDHVHPFVLGFLELLTYPVLMASGSWTAIGAWIGLKTVAQWDRWKLERDIFNNFLIGNAVVVIASYMFLARHITFG